MSMNEDVKTGNDKDNRLDVTMYGNYPAETYEKLIGHDSPSLYSSGPYSSGVINGEALKDYLLAINRLLFDIKREVKELRRLAEQNHGISGDDNPPTTNSEGER